MPGRVLSYWLSLAATPEKARIPFAILPCCWPAARTASIAEAASRSTLLSESCAKHWQSLNQHVKRQPGSRSDIQPILNHSIARVLVALITAADTDTGIQGLVTLVAYGWFASRCGDCSSVRGRWCCVRCERLW